MEDSWDIVGWSTRPGPDWTLITNAQEKYQILSGEKTTGGCPVGAHYVSLAEYMFESIGNAGGSEYRAGLLVGVFIYIIEKTKVLQHNCFQKRRGK